MHSLGSRSRAAAALVVLAAGVVGCGGDGNADAKRDKVPETRAPLAQEEALAERNLISTSEISKQPRGSVERAFAEYWSAIGNEEWSVAVQFFSSGVREALDPGYLVQALRIEGQNNVPVKPLVRETRQSRGQTTVRYFVRRSTGKLRPTSSAWEERDGDWYIAYSSTLDDSYAAAVQQGVQSESAPKSRTADEEALRAAARAARTQAQTLTPRR